MERLTLQEYKKRYGGNPIAEKEDKTALWYMNEDIPPGEYYGTTAERAELDADLILEQMTSDYCIDTDTYDYAGLNELKEFLKEWNEKYGVDVYYVNEECEVVV